MSIAPGKAGKVRYRSESALGVGTGSWKDIQLQGMATFNDQNVELFDVPYVRRNPLDCGETQPIGLQMHKDGMVSMSVSFNRASANGDTPQIIKFLKSMGLDESVASADAAVDTGAAVGSIPLKTDQGALGRATLVELQVTQASEGFPDGTLYWPVLAAAYAASTITPAMDVPKAPVEDDVATAMHTITAKTSTSYEVPSTASIQLLLKTWAETQDAAGDHAKLVTACFLESFNAINIPNSIGESINVDLSFSGMQNNTPTDEDMEADDPNDSGVPLLVTPDFRFLWGDANASGGISHGTFDVSDLSFNPGWVLIRSPDHGVTNIGGCQGMVLQATPPTCTFSACITGTVYDEIMSEAENALDGGTQTEKFLAAIQPTRNLDTPSLGIWMPNCVLINGSKEDAAGDFVKGTFTYRGGLSGYNSETDIDESGAPSFFLALGSEAG